MNKSKNSIGSSALLRLFFISFPALCSFVGAGGKLFFAPRCRIP